MWQDEGTWKIVTEEQILHYLTHDTSRREKLTEAESRTVIAKDRGGGGMWLSLNGYILCYSKWIIYGDLL